MDIKFLRKLVEELEIKEKFLEDYDDNLTEKENLRSSALKLNDFDEFKKLNSEVENLKILKTSIDGELKHMKNVLSYEEIESFLKGYYSGYNANRNKIIKAYEETARKKIQETKDFLKVAYDTAKSDLSGVVEFEEPDDINVIDKAIILSGIRRHLLPMTRNSELTEIKL